MFDNAFLMMYVFKEHVKILKIYMVKFNVAIFNRLQRLGFFIYKGKN